MAEGHSPWAQSVSDHVGARATARRGTEDPQDVKKVWHLGRASARHDVGDGSP